MRLGAPKVGSKRVAVDQSEHRQQKTRSDVMGGHVQQRVHAAQTVRVHCAAHTVAFARKQTSAM